jgi:CRP/FNR family cyclic AMP-dependent transcriptional regulator
MLATDKQVAALVAQFKKGTRLTYKRGEFIIRPGEAPPGVFYIEAGQVKAYNISKYGEENLLIIRKEHEIFPLIWAITSQERHIMYEAIGPTTVWRMSHDEFLKLLHEHPDITPVMLDMVTEMYRIHSERIINLEYRSVRERLISFLISMADRFGLQSTEGIVINAPLRQQDIASSINASRETTSRELAALERKGLVKNGQGVITLTDVKALKKFL